MYRVVGTLALSVVVPLHNEEENVPRLFPALEEACGPMGVDYEVIFVDDGSTDGTWEALQRLQPGSSRLVCARLGRNSGQTPAMAAGFELSRGDVVVTMDGDLQNDPADIPELVQQCAEGSDLVCGWRRDRQDKLWTRKIPSKCANWLIRKVTGVHIHDYGCSLKAFRRGLVDGMRLYSDMHRFLPFVAQRSGARISERVVRHHARRYGVTKYGLGRTWKVLFDLVSLKLLVHYFRRPLLGFALLALLPVLLGTAVLWAALAGGTGGTVLFGSGVVLVSMGFFVLLLGLLSDLALRGEWREFEQLLVQDAGGPA